MDTGSDNEQPKSTASPTNIKVQPYDENHVNLVHYNPLATAEENLARARNLDQRGIFFTKDAYDYYHPSEYADLFSLSDAYHDASIALSRENFAKEQGALQEDPVVVKREESVQEDNPSVSIGLNEEKLAEEQDATALKRKLSTEEIPREVVEEKSKKPKPDVGHSQKETTVIDQVLTSMLRAKQPHQQQLQREPSDLEIVAMAAGLGCYQQGDGNAQQYQQPTSRYTKEQHRKFLENAAELRRVGYY
jgi:hypothetical protein